MKLHEIQQALEALGIWEAIKRASSKGGGITQVNNGGGTWGTIVGDVNNQTDLIAKLNENEELIKRYTFLMT